MTWMFSCLLQDGGVRGYTLRFNFASRKFSVRPHLGGQSAAYARRMAEKDLFDLPEVQRAVPLKGRVTDLLRARLSAEQIARATAMAIRQGMRK